MTFHLIGLGLNQDSITQQAYKACQKAKKIYLENYTVDFPYTIKQLEKNLKLKPGTKIQPLSRQQVESQEILKHAKKQSITLLVYGDALSATTHISLIEECKKKKISYKIYHNASILTAIAETGLQLYKFGKTASMPTWQTSFKPTSFIDIIKQNQKIKAHSLLLIDINLDFQQAKQQLKQASKEKNLKLNKIITCSQLGTNKTKIHYNTLDRLPKNIPEPYCIIIPSTLHFSEKDFLEKF